MIYESVPKDFNPKFEIVSCFMEHNGEILLLHRQDHKAEGNTLGVPAGKIDEGESATAAIIREIKEETNYDASKDNVTYFGKVYVRYSTYDFTYHIFHLVLKKKPEITINLKEHKDYVWASPKNSLKMNLIQDECIKLFYGLK
jgi:8-oxo-dGTP pyrophosphatase MutT (NUDIX family)